MSLDEKKELCDFLVVRYGGYGKSIDCGNGVTLDANANQDECVAMTPTNCAATVSQVEECLNTISCTSPLPAVCASLFACGSTQK